MHKLTRREILLFMARVAVFGAIASLLYIVPIFNFSLPIFPPFLKIHFDEIPAFIAGLAYGPWCSLAIIVLKTIIKLPFTSTLTVGEWSDLIYGCALVLPAAFIYKYWKNKFSFPLALTIGMLSQLIVSLIMNIYVMIPFYAFVMGFGMDAILQMFNTINPLITDTQWSMGFYGILPFNLIKDGIVIAVTILIYLPLKSIIKNISNNNKSKDIAE